MANEEALVESEVEVSRLVVVLMLLLLVDKVDFAAEDDEVESFVGGFVITVIFCKEKTSLNSFNRYGDKPLL